MVNLSCSTASQLAHAAGRAAGWKRPSGVPLHLGQEFIQALAFGSTERVHDHSVDRPVVVLPVGNVAPRRQPETGNGAQPRLHPPPMLPEVGALNFDVDVARARVTGHALPLAPGQLDGIAGVGGDADAEA